MQSLDNNDSFQNKAKQNKTNRRRGTSERAFKNFQAKRENNDNNSNIKLQHRISTSALLF
jgi:hypothetical protein